MPITRIQTYENCLKWIKDKKASLKSGADIWRRSRFCLAKLANFHGYVLAGFELKDNKVAKYDLSTKVFDNARANQSSSS